MASLQSLKGNATDPNAERLAPKHYFESAVMIVTVFQWLVFASLIGLSVGLAVSLFLKSLFWSTSQGDSVPAFRYLLLPLAGFANGLLLYYGYKIKKSRFNDSVILAVHEQNGRIPLRTFFIKPIAALITLGCGGSAGKESPCAHIGGSLASGIGRFFRLNKELQKRLVACGISAGFAGVFGTPLAGAIYGVEVLTIGRIRHDFLLPAVISGIISYQTCVFLGVPYTMYPPPFLPAFSAVVFLKMLLIGILCGLIARLFVDSYHATTSLFTSLKERYHLWPPLLPLLGGVLLSACLLVIPFDYFGLSLGIMDRALAGESVSPFGFLYKIFLVVLTLGSGFYGGIVTPQFVIGTLAGNAIAELFGFNPTFGAAVGLVSVVAASSNTPVAAIFMGIELFGAEMGTFYIAGPAMAAYLVIGHRSVYPDQWIAFTKSSWILADKDPPLFGLPLQKEKLHLSYGLLRWVATMKKKVIHNRQHSSRHKQ